MLGLSHQVGDLHLEIVNVPQRGTPCGFNRLHMSSYHMAELRTGIKKIKMLETHLKFSVLIYRLPSILFILMKQKNSL